MMDSTSTQKQGTVKTYNRLVLDKMYFFDSARDILHHREVNALEHVDHT